MLLEVTELTKAFRDTMAVDHISCTLGNGVYGLLGVNGAGKTTFMRMLCTLLLPDSGAIRWDGSDIFSMGGAYRKLLGYLPQDFGYYPDFTIQDYLLYIASIKGLRPAYAKKHAEQLLQQVGLWDIRKQKMKKLSGGMKRKLMICRALLTEPEILLLDEPTAGMDAISRRQMWHLLRQLNEKGLTILLTTHYIEEAQALCHRVALMNSGKLNDVDTPAHLIDKLGAYAVDEHRPDGIHSRYFPDREQAIAYLSGLEGQCTLRDTTLEDVFVEQAGKRLS